LFFPFARVFRFLPPVTFLPLDFLRLPPTSGTPTPDPDPDPAADVPAAAADCSDGDVPSCFVGDEADIIDPIIINI
jgi:hypothetical protein